MPSVAINFRVVLEQARKTRHRQAGARCDCLLVRHMLPREHRWSEAHTYGPFGARQSLQTLIAINGPS